MTIEIIAHRGYSARAPENTLAALRRALEVGADALEFDLHVTADGVPVLLHDEMLERTTNGLGPVALVKLKELQQLDAGTWFGGGFARERVPTLAEALALAAGTDPAPSGPHGAAPAQPPEAGRRCAHVYPEIKGYRTLRDVERMAREVHEAGWADACSFISMDWEALEAVRDASGALQVGYIAETPERWGPALERAAAVIEAEGEADRALVDCDYRLLLRTPGRVAAARARGVDLVVWTVDDPEDARRLVELGVTRLTTNEVETVRAAVGAGEG